MLSVVCLSLVSIFATNHAIAGENVSVVIGSNASNLEKLAAGELAKQFKKLFNAAVNRCNKRP